MRNTAEHNVIKSADLTVFPQSGQVEINGHVISLGLVNMRVLLVLLGRAGEVVSRVEMFERVWENQTVSDDTLTRCISEIRAQLSKHTACSQLIETLPKRGYRWVPGVDDMDCQVADVIASEKGKPRGGWKQVVILATTGMAALLVFIMVVLWLIDNSLRSDVVRVALIPVYAAQAGQRSVAADLDDLLREKLLATRNLRFFARSAVSNSQQNPFPFTSREFNVQWIIEGNIRQKQDKVRVSLSLVDAKTALVAYTMTQDIDGGTTQLEDLCVSFINEVSGVLRLDQG
jgi:DNA-binding winged helix-turn-helix (wHTH) protein/TolB-like protein